MKYMVRDEFYVDSCLLVKNYESNFMKSKIYCRKQNFLTTDSKNQFNCLNRYNLVMI